MNIELFKLRLDQVNEDRCHGSSGALATAATEASCSLLMRFTHFTLLSRVDRFLPILQVDICFHPDPLTHL